MTVFADGRHGVPSLPFRFGLRTLPVKHSHVTDDLQQGAAGGGGDALGKFAAFLFEVGELDFDQFVQGQFVLDAGQESLADAVVPHFEDGFEELRPPLEAATVGGCQFGLQEGKMAGSA